MSSACNLPHRLKGSLLAAAIIASLIVALGGAPAGAQPAPRIAVHTDAASFGAVAGPTSTIDFEALPGNASSCPIGPTGERVANPLSLSGVTFTDPACLTIGTLGQTNDRLLCLNPGGTIALPTGALGILLNVTGIGDATASFRATDGRGGTTTGSVRGVPFQITPLGFTSPDGIARVEVLPGGGIACFSSVVGGSLPSAQSTTIDFESLPASASSCPVGPSEERVANPLTLSGVTFTDPFCLRIGTLGQTNDRLLCLNPGGTITPPAGTATILLNVTGIGDATASFRATDGRGGTTTRSVQGIPFQITPVSFSSADGIVRVEVLPGGIACFSSVVVSGAGPSAPATCAGLTPTKTAVAGVPTQGTAGRDVILGTPGNDIIRGGTGDDIICGVGGNDEIYGEGGDDTLYGDAGMDTLDGGFGNDALHGGDGDDTLRGGGGNDTLRGGAGADTLEGDAGNDQLFGEADADILRGGTGNDRLEDTQGAGQTFDGGPGTNTCVGVGTAAPPVVSCQALP